MIGHFPKVGPTAKKSGRIFPEKYSRIRFMKLNPGMIDWHNDDLVHVNDDLCEYFIPLMLQYYILLYVIWKLN